jgi:hypothetical protein
MSPIFEIVPRRGTEGEGYYKRGIVANLPDQSGEYEVDGQKIKLDVYPPESTFGRPAVSVESKFFKGHLRRPAPDSSYYANERRVVFLNKNGTGAQTLSTQDKLIVYREK